MIHFIIFTLLSFVFTYALIKYTNYIKVFFVLFVLVILYAIIFDKVDDVFSSNLSTGAYIGTVLGAIIGAVIGFEHNDNDKDLIDMFGNDRKTE